MKHPLLQHEIDREAKLTADRDRLRAALRELVDGCRAEMLDDGSGWYSRTGPGNKFRDALLSARAALEKGGETMSPD